MQYRPLYNAVTVQRAVVRAIFICPLLITVSLNTEHAAMRTVFCRPVTLAISRSNVAVLRLVYFRPKSGKSTRYQLLHNFVSFIKSPTYNISGVSCQVLLKHPKTLLGQIRTDIKNYQSRPRISLTSLTQ